MIIFQTCSISPFRATPNHVAKEIVNYIAGILETQDIEAWEEFIENPRENDDAWE